MSSLIEGAIRFQDMRLDMLPLSECDVTFESEDKNTRLYTHKNDAAFSALAVIYVSTEPESEDHWTDKNLEVEKVFEAHAHFDGVRHLEFNRNGTDMDGYLNYPDIPALIAMLQEVRRMELDLCPEAEF